MKEKLKSLILQQLEKTVISFFANHPAVKLVVVVGSVGKTSTKLAIAKVLKSRYKVLVHTGNHNTEFSVPLALLDVPYPENIYSPLSWWRVLSQMRRQAKAETAFGYDVIVAEIGTDKPGDIASFGRYLRPQLAVITAVSPEHMEYFESLEAVAREELSVAEFSQQVLVNRDDVEEAFAALVKNPMISTYGIGGVAEYHFLPEQTEDDGRFGGKFVSPEFGETPVALKVIGEHSVKALVAAGAVGVKFGLQPADIAPVLNSITAVPGRMQLLRGIHGSLIIDDTYNASPLATTAALKTLYSLHHPQRIAILGSMNELGESSAVEHQRIGELCDPSLLEWVVTIGGEAQAYIAPAATAKGCRVRSFASAYDAGAFVRTVLQPEAVVLVKGSQNGVYAEEAIKLFLRSIDDESRLVRQSPAWQRKKQAFFDKFSREK